MVSTYNEPLITAEWAVAIFRQARAAGLLTGFVSNGNVTPQVLDYIRPWVDLYKVDLKSFNDRRYRELGGRIQPILDGLRRIYQMGFWLEVVTLIVPGFNDSDDELERMAAYLAGISPDIPWHVTAFHRDYRMTTAEDTPAETLLRAVSLGKRTGLRYVYAGNRTGEVGEAEHTCCAGCGTCLVRRRGYRILDYRITAEGRCPACGIPVPGRWATAFRKQITGRPFLPIFSTH